MHFWKLYKVPLLLSLVSFLLYWSFAYDLVRTEYMKLILLYSGLWIVFLLLLQTTKKNYKFLTIIAFISRGIFLFAIPNLSQDFYRFIWDGRMILEGFNPYLYTPESFIIQGDFPVNQAQELYNGMGELNGSHFTNYPPINQLCFLIAVMFSGTSILGSVVVFRIIIIFADLGILFFGSRLLELLKLPKERIFWYVLNPFIIIELTGNLHFEGVMIFFLIWSLYLLFKGRWQWAAVLFSLSISVKLMPLLFLPLFFKFFKSENSNKLNFKRLFSFYVIIGFVTLALFLPFFNSQFVSNYSETVALWFNNFEFNGSIYYVLREIGFLFRGYNEIAIIGKILAISVFLLVVGLSIFKNFENSRVLIERMLIAFAIYLFLSTTVHPWYLSTLLVLSLFTNYRFPIIWTFVIILSYLAYLNINSADKSENLWVIALEYIIVYGVFLWEVVFRKANLTKE